MVIYGRALVNPMDENSKARKNKIRHSKTMQVQQNTQIYAYSGNTRKGIVMGMQWYTMD